VLVGIDLGTTNSALAWSERGSAIRIFEVPQLVAPGETARHPTLPSFLYIPTESEQQSGTVRLPWDPSPRIVAGIFAREQGALVQARQVSSAKSWLSNALVDRAAPLLPWGMETGRKLSPVEASAGILAHLRDAWQHDQNGRLEEHHIVLTVPASFDEEARELTVAAARQARFAQVTLLEEPLAALYAWIARHRHALAATFGTGALILVCDVGGGTTDFSLIRARATGEDLEFERIAIGEHLLLGGDNLDLALAAIVEQKMGGGRLTLVQRQTLRRKCSASKEQLLGDPSVERVPITILGAGRGVVSGGLTAELTRDEVATALLDGFLPLTAGDDLPSRDRRTGLRELGLPYETEPAITRHLAGFLARAGRAAGGAMARPDAVLFNGGFFTPPLARQRVVDALTGWFGTPPAVLENERPEAAIAIGAAFYGRLRSDPAASRRLLIRAGTARTYYIGVAGADHGHGIPAVCLMPRGTEEGTRLLLDHEFIVTTNQPAAFTLYSSLERSDPTGAIVSLEPDRAHQHAPLVTALRYGKRSRRVPLSVRLSVVFTETGTLELWCESQVSEHRWRLSFNLRSVEADPLAEAVGEAQAGDSRAGGVVVTDEAVNRAADLIRSVFGQGTSPVTPEGLTGELEGILGYSKHDWPLEVIRKLADVLLQVVTGRTKSAANEVRWLNLAGFCTRPGLGSSLDEWRVSELRKVYAAGLAFPRDIQCQVEWLVLWQRVSAGFSTGQQRELAQRVSGQLGIGQRKPPRLNAQIERESWRLLAGLERIDANQRAKLGQSLIGRLAREPRNTHWTWAVGRFGARAPLYGPLNSVVSPEIAEDWIRQLLALKQVTPEIAGVIAQIGARTDDPARDISESLAADAAARLRGAAVHESIVEGLLTPVPPQRIDTSRLFGESLPHGLALRSATS
jgi:molecular chaperone DnaK (HSP70)